MASGDIYRTALRFSVNGEKTVNVLHFKQTSADGAGPVVKEVCDAVEEDIWSLYKLCLSNDCTLQSIAAHRIDPTVGGSIVVDVNEAGSIAQDTIPPNACICATLYSDNLTRTGRGRMYISGVPDTHVDRGCVDNTAGSLYVTLLDALLAPIQAGAGVTFQACIWSPTDVAGYDITHHSLRSTLRNLRSRRMANP